MKSSKQKQREQGQRPAKESVPANEEEELDEALEESFPASDPPSPTRPDHPGGPRKER